MATAPLALLLPVLVLLGYAFALEARRLAAAELTQAHAGDRRPLSPTCAYPEFAVRSAEVVMEDGTRVPEDALLQAELAHLLGIRADVTPGGSLSAPHRRLRPPLRW